MATVLDRLQAIRHCCLHLREISIDIKSSRDGSIGRDLFAELALFPRPSAVNLAFDTGEDMASIFPGWSSNPVPSIAVTFAANPFQRVHPRFAENILSALREEKGRSNTTPLKRVKIMVHGNQKELDILNNKIKRLLPPVFSGAPLEHAYQVPFDHLPQFIGV